MARSGAGDDGDRTRRDVERGGDHRDQFGIRRSLHWRRVQSHEHCIVTRSRDAGLSGTWNHADSQDDAGVGGFEEGHIRRGPNIIIGDVPTPYESARLNLQLFEMRREPVLREARAWFLVDFNPETLQELTAILSGERNASFRMVLGYWDMAASLVTTGAIDADAFRAAHGEMFATFSKIEPFLADIRAATGETAFCAHLEVVIMGARDAPAIMKRRRDAIRAAAKARQAAADVSS